MFFAVDFCWKASSHAHTGSPAVAETRCKTKHVLTLQARIVESGHGCTSLPPNPHLPTPAVRNVWEENVELVFTHIDVGRRTTGLLPTNQAAVRSRLCGLCADRFLDNDSVRQVVLFIPIFFQPALPGTPNNQKQMVVPIWQLKSFT